MRHVEDHNLQDQVDVRASFCFEQCDKGPTVVVGDKLIHKCTFNQACTALNEAMNAAK